MEKVVHCKKEKFDVYIGRPSKWGNPFTHINDRNTAAEYVVSSREEAVKKYREWILTQPHLLNELHELKGKVLGCWCKPQLCHGDVLVELINRKMEKQKFRIIIAGSREFNDYELLKEKLDHLLVKKREEFEIVIVSGTANGADKLGERYATDMGFNIDRYPADWNQYGKSAGYMRNVQMAENADACVVFRVNNSKGSTHMINIANEKKLLLRYYDI